MVYLVSLVYPVCLVGRIGLGEPKKPDRQRNHMNECDKRR